MSTIKTIQYRGFEIMVNRYDSRAGTAYAATNNYGEPYTNGRFFKSEEEAIKHEQHNLDLCLDQ